MVEDLHLSKKEFAKRVSVTKNDLRAFISIKAPHFSLGNSFLTFILSIGIVAEFIIGYLMVTKPIHLEIFFPLLIVFTGIFIIVFTRMWLWHHFGEEQIEIRGNKLSSYRRYALFNTPKESLVFNTTSQLYVNHDDSWSWMRFRKKGTLRLTSDSITIDFGMGLDYQEYESITRLIGTYIEKFKSIASESVNGKNSMEAISTNIPVGSKMDNLAPSTGLHKSA